MAKGPLNKDELVLGRESPGGKDWFVLGRECVDCIKENFLGLSYLCDYDYQTGEIRSRKFARVFGAIDSPLG